MGSDITLFSGYAQKENRTTNYCLLVVKMLYEENPKFLGEVLSNLIDEELADVVGVQFRQQVRKQGSVPDGLVVQRPLTIYFETKNFDWFHDAQLERHLEALDGDGQGTKVLIALGNFEALSEQRFHRIEGICRDKYERSVYFAAITFEDFLAALRSASASKNLLDVLGDFEGYLDEVGLLPRWKYRLDVVNCSGRPAEVLKEGVYICPAKGGAYNHARSRYFGMYQGRRVRFVAQIEGVVDVQADGQTVLRWKNVEAPDAGLIAMAIRKRDQLRPGAEAVRVFLLGPLFETDFAKPSAGGMQTSKRYFDVEGLGVRDASALALKLRGRTWADYLEVSSGPA